MARRPYKAPTVPVAAGAEQAALGALFRAVRERRGWAQIALADRMGISVNTLRWHEAGAVLLRAHHLRRAAALLGVPVGELVGEPASDHPPVEENTA